MSRGALNSARCDLYTSVGRLPPAAEGREKLDLIKERIRAIEGIGDYPFVDMAELCLGHVGAEVTAWVSPSFFLALLAPNLLLLVLAGAA